ncbi:MAG: hypothetical protein IJY44_02160 [Bacteroidaceae bacterium]|nr:hypothetical protein [Bacteroidaceae bacterium]
MTKLKSGIVLNEGENLVMELEAELWATSSNPIAKLIGAIKRVFALILGIKKEGFVVITDKRVVEVIRGKYFYFFDSGKVIRYLLPSGIKEIGYTKEPTFFCFCPAYQLFYEAYTQRTSVLLSDVDEAGAQRVVDAFYNALYK